MGPEELEVTTFDGRFVEKHVPLPEQWLRGFAEAQVLAAGFTLRAEVPAAEAAAVLRALPARSGVVVDPPFPPAAAGLFGPYPRRKTSLGEPAAPFWVAQLPYHREELMARDYMESPQAGRGRTGILPLVAESGGPAEYAVHLALAIDVRLDPDAVVDALLVLAARGQLDGGLLGEQIEVLIRAQWVESNRVHDALRGAADTDAYGTVWSVLAAALPGLLRHTPVRGAGAFLSLGVACASQCGAKGEIPEVTAVAERTGSSQSVKNARLLRDALR